MNSPTIAPAQSRSPVASQRLLFLDALRAFASVTILLHHFALYPPLSLQAEPLIGPLVQWFSTYARSTQVFFIIGGYVMARSMAASTWNLEAVGKFLAQRYCRLGFPYLAAIALAIAASAWGRGWLPESVAGSPPSASQLIAHVFFLQDVLGFEHLSAGLWFVCINFQLGMIYVLALWLRDAFSGRSKTGTSAAWIELPILAGWVLSAFSLFYFNRHSEFDPWALYFFPYFFMGIIIQRTATRPNANWMFWLYILMFAAASSLAWHWRLASGGGPRAFRCGEERAFRPLAHQPLGRSPGSGFVQSVSCAFPRARRGCGLVGAPRVDLAACCGRRAACRICRKRRVCICISPLARAAGGKSLAAVGVSAQGIDFRSLNSANATSILAVCVNDRCSSARLTRSNGNTALLPRQRRASQYRYAPMQRQEGRSLPGTY